MRKQLTQTEKEQITNGYSNMLKRDEWNHFITVRLNYKTTDNTVKKVSEKVFKRLDGLDKLFYVGERDKLDKDNKHIHILTKDIHTTEKLEKKLKTILNNSDTMKVERVGSNESVCNYLCKNMYNDLQWDILNN
jgi:endonuclease III